jgi:hypothetical protein
MESGQLQGMLCRMLSSIEPVFDRVLFRIVRQMEMMQRVNGPS